MSEGIYLQYGCGMSAPSDWINFDCSPTLVFEKIPIIGKVYTKNSRAFPDNVKYGDIVKGLPVPENHCQGIYCSHVLEHLSLVDCRKALYNTYYILKKGGVFRLVVPDLEASICKYIENPDNEAAIIFMKETGLGKESRKRRLSSFFIDWLGNSGHRWMWDYKALEFELSKAGFKEIRRAYYGDATDKMFNKVEDEGRWIGCLGIQCIK